MAFEALARRRFALLTTWRRSGVSVSTPVWVVVADGKAYVVSRGAGKVKRIRNNPAVEISPCTMRGTSLGAAEQGTARILDGDAPTSLRRALRRKYGPMPGLSRRLAKAFRNPLWILEIAEAADAEAHAGAQNRGTTSRRQRPLRAPTRSLRQDRPPQADS